MLLLGVCANMLNAQPYMSTDLPPSCYEINAHVRNGLNEFEGALYTPSTPYIGQPGGARYKLDPIGKPVWNTGGNQYGDTFSFKLIYTPATGTTSWNVDFNRDGDFTDYEESAFSTAPTMAGRGFQYINVLGQGYDGNLTVTLKNLTINGVDFGTFTSNSNTPFTQLFEDASGLFNDIAVTGNFSFSGSGSKERPRLWIQLGESNIAPTCILTGPADGSTFNLVDTILITATALDPTGKINVVEFFDGDIKIGEDHSFPFTFEWTSIPAGTRTLRAKATDNHQAYAYSSPVFILVSDGPTQNTTWPRITSPSDGYLFYDPDTIPITAEMINPNDTVYVVEFFRDDTSLGKDSIVPYLNTSLLNPAMGHYTITARSRDVASVISTSPPIHFSVRCIREDINVDGLVSTLDFLLLLGAYGNGCPGGCASDFNDDQVVSTLDFLSLLARYGYSCN